MSGRDLEENVIETVMEIVDRTSGPTTPFVVRDELQRRSDVSVDATVDFVLTVLVTGGHLEWNDTGLTRPDDEPSSVDRSTDTHDYLPFTDEDGHTVYLGTETLVVTEQNIDCVGNDYRAHSDQCDSERSDTRPNRIGQLRDHDWYFDSDLTDCDYEPYLQDDE